MPLAPGLFSTTMDQPALSSSFFARVRAMKSLPPPAVVGTMILIGRVGKAWPEAAAPASAAQIASDSWTSKVPRLPSFMVCLRELEGQLKGEWVTVCMALTPA